jgi:hypothetical protein
MDQSRESSAPRARYRWPWFVLGAVILAVVLAVLWMAVAVRRTRALRDTNPLPSSGEAGSPGESGSGGTNSAR